jgi:aryl-phospho-beta-D-glucosidase BglC (GH1 family)
MKKNIINFFSAVALLLVMAGCGSKSETRVTEFETAKEAVSKMTAGWNLGNSLDAFSSDIEAGAPIEQYQSCWGQPLASKQLMKLFADKGFNAIRIPVTWWQHQDSDGNVDSLWMNRVEEVVNYVLDNGMYCILNVHHDTGAAVEAWIKADSTSYATGNARFKELWTQIANHFRDYGQELLFEGYNEMLTGSNPNAEWSQPKDLGNLQYINLFAQDFVDAVRATGGKNTYRNLIVNTYSGSHTPNTLGRLVIPTDPCGNQSHLAVEVHSYDPWDWVNTYDMHWTKECSDEVERLFADLDKHFISKGYPVIIGEYGSNGDKEKTINGRCTPEQQAEAGRQAADITRLCKKRGAAAFYWMGLVDNTDRSEASLKWSMEQVADSIVNNAK